MDGICAFCNVEDRLRESHVLPAFVYRWLRSRSGVGHIRRTDSPNRRVQDGVKLQWLCDDCETLFSGYETAFATKLFYPWQDGTNRIAYNEWLLSFCVSISWRVLKYARGRNSDAKYTDKQQKLMDEAALRWRAFIGGNVANPGAFEQHLLIFDLIDSTTVPDLPSNINRFMMGTVSLDIIGSEHSLMTFAKLGRFMIFGMIQKGQSRWDGTKVHVKQGLLKPGKFTIPSGLIHYIRRNATLTALALELISDIQRQKIEKNLSANTDAFLASEQFKSIAADVSMFGNRAFTAKDIL